MNSQIEEPLYCLSNHHIRGEYEKLRGMSPGCLFTTESTLLYVTAPLCMKYVSQDGTSLVSVLGVLGREGTTAAVLFGTEHSLHHTRNTFSVFRGDPVFIYGCVFIRKKEFKLATLSHSVTILKEVMH